MARPAPSEKSPSCNAGMQRPDVVSSVRLSALGAAFFCEANFVGGGSFCEVNFVGGGSLAELSAHWTMCPSHLSAFGGVSHRGLARLPLPPCPAARSPPGRAGSCRACRAIACAPACTVQLPRRARRAPRGPARLAPNPPFLWAARATLRRARRLRPLCHAPPLARRPYKFTTRTRLCGRTCIKN